MPEGSECVVCEYERVPPFEEDEEEVNDEEAVYVKFWLDISLLIRDSRFAIWLGRSLRFLDAFGVMNRVCVERGLNVAGLCGVESQALISGAICSFV